MNYPVHIVSVGGLIENDEDKIFEVDNDELEVFEKEFPQKEKHVTASQLK